MGFREIRSSVRQPDMFEDASALESIIRQPAPKTPVILPDGWKTTFSPDSKPLEDFPLVKRRFNFHLPEMDKVLLKRVVILGIKFVVGVALVYFGLTFTGSAFGPASGKFLKEYATIFYQYQVGTLLAMVGAILVYDGLKRR